jgi:YidC/Oxa1 family membrane protein insertase
VFELALEELTLQKTFVIPDSGRVLEVEQRIVKDRLGLTAWGLSWAGGMRVTEKPLGTIRGDYFQGGVRAEGKVQRKGTGHVQKNAQEFPGTTYFVASMSKYFVGAIVPLGDQQGPAKLWHVPSSNESEASVGAEILSSRNSSLAADTITYGVYIGPLDYAQLARTGLGIEGVVDLGAKWIQPIARVILSFLIWLHGIIPNYGVVIILFSSAINLLFFPLTYKSTRSMRDMAALKPRLDALKVKYKDEPQKMQEATMKLYKEAGVNPLAGCMPLLLQMPIFFALYAVLFRTIELRQEPFILWMHDLSQPDVVFQLPFSLPLIGSGVCLLPIIMGISSYFQSKGTMVDPNQKMMIYMMPVMMTYIFFTMPSGLVLYWLTSNLFTIGQKALMKPSAGAEAIAETPVVAEKRPKKKRSSAKNAGPAEATSEG